MQVRTLPGLLLLLTHVLGQEIEELERDDFGRLSRGERDAPAVFARLPEGGQIRLRVGEEWRAATLAEYGDLVRKSVAERTREMRENRKKGTVLVAAVEPDATTPWVHVQWLMAVIAEGKCRSLEFALGERRLLYGLPPPRSERPAEPQIEIKVSIHIVARDEQPAKWGEQEVTSPTKFIYRFGDRESESLGDAREHMAKAVRAAEGSARTHVVGEIKAGRKVPFRRVLDLMDAFVDAGIADVHLYGTQIPSTAVRSASRLPYPRNNYGPD